MVFRLSKFDPGCSSRIRILIFYPSRIQGSKRHRIPDPGSGSATLEELFNLHIKTVAGGVSVLTGRRVVRVDPVKQEAVLHDGTVIRQDGVQYSTIGQM
jgi:hypothetical protein